MPIIGIIGGSGLASLQGLSDPSQRLQKTPYGEHSGILTTGNFNDRKVVFLARHGNPHVIPPHKINYRANIWALREVGAEKIIAINAVGGITAAMQPGVLAIPDQIIDYTWGRGHTFFEDGLNNVVHVDCTQPYSPDLRRLIIRAGDACGISLIPQATYGATQGPRLETAAEIARMERDGCDLVGMTGMPEAILARELDLDYASVCMVVNRAAGKTGDMITMEIIEKYLGNCTAAVMRLLPELLNLL